MEDSFFIVTKQILDYLFCDSQEKYEMAEQMRLFLAWRKNCPCGNKALILKSELDAFEKEWANEPEVIAQVRSFVQPQSYFIEDTKKSQKENMIFLANNLSAFGKFIRIIDNELTKDNDFDIRIGKLSIVYSIEKAYEIIKQNKAFYDYIGDKYFSVSS